MKVRLTSEEKDLIYVVLNELVKMPYGDLNKLFGSLTIKDIQSLEFKMKYADYCNRHGVRLKDLTDEDFERFCMEKIEKEERESYTYYDLYGDEF